MAVKTVFVDGDNHEMECYLNADGKVFISVADSLEDIAYSGHIVLDKNDVNELIKILTDIAKEMED